MSLLKNFAQETINAPGTSAACNLAGASTGRSPFISTATFASGDTPYYFMDDGTQREWGIGLVTAGSPNVFTRTTVLGNSAGTTSRLNFTGVTTIYSEVPAEKMVLLDAVGDVALPGDLAVAGTASIPNIAGDLSVAGLLSGKGTVPIGTGLDYWGTTLPAGWLWANGAAVSRTTYAALFAAIGTVGGPGNGTTTFNVPNKSERISIGRGTMGGVAAAGLVTTAGSGLNGTTLGATGGDQSLAQHTHNVTDPTHTHTLNNPAHSHGVSESPHTHTAVGVGVGIDGVNGGTGAHAVGASVTTSSVSTGLSVNSATTAVSANAASTGITINATGGGFSGNMPPSIVCNYIIFAGV